MLSLISLLHDPTRADSSGHEEQRRGVERERERKRERIVEEWRLRTSAWRMVRFLMVTTKVLGTTTGTRHGTRLPRRRCPLDGNSDNGACF